MPLAPTAFAQDQNLISNETGTVNWTAPTGGTYDYRVVKDGDAAYTYEANPSLSYEFTSLIPANCTTATIKSVFNCSNGDIHESANVTTDLCTGI